VNFEIELNGRTRRVAVERSAPGRYRVTLDDTSHDVDASRAGEYGLSLLLGPDRGTSHDVQIAPAGPPGELLVTLEGRTVAVTVNGRRMRRGGADRPSDVDGEQKILAPMPGRVVRILAAPGDLVAARQPVIVVEAMKMENELRSPKSGRVKQVAVAEGMSVESGRVLIVIE
jgi:acetyl/propionyl-CoA carboxylase alpha subunit